MEEHPMETVPEDILICDDASGGKTLTAFCLNTVSKNLQVIIARHFFSLFLISALQSVFIRLSNNISVY